ncbi:helix-turn-helix domain-containing protein [Kitasatospora cheerisanensis]|uniref:helix-turn-helix domain-containing protein n=1 Tax=Kitasatospora cheerisanensis TaxID=81942 RepID=UPI0014321B14
MTPNGTAIRAFREARELSIRRLAELASMHNGHLSRLERGVAGVSDQGLRRIAAALDVPVAAINREETP